MLKIIHPGIRRLLLGAVTLSLAACSDLAPDSPLSHARRTPEALAQAALEALAVESDSALQALLVSRDEYETLLWPEMPDREYTPFEFVWSMNEANSRKARNRVMGEFGGVPLELVEVDLGDEREEYETFTLYQDARMTVRRTDNGEEGVFPLMDALVIKGGGWKFLNYREET